MRYESEEEQIEALRRWWQENALSVIAGLVIAVLAVGGWQAWEYWEERQAQSASAGYENVTATLQSEDLDGAREALEALQADHAGSPQAALASMSVGRALLQADDTDAAMEVLDWATNNAPGEALGRLARLRLAQAQLQADAVDDALATLDPVPEGAYAARFQELRGDLLVVRGESEAAAEAYRAAVAADPVGGRRELIDRKLTDLGSAREGSS